VISPPPGLSTAAVSDAAAKALGRSAMKERIIPGPWAVASSELVVAEAFTVQITYTGATGGTGVADWLDAFDGAPEGAFTIVTAGNPVDTALVGDAAGRRLRVRDGAGILVYGTTRDVSGFLEVGLPLWTRATSFEGTPIGECDVEYGIPIRCGGVEISPGDVVVADASGALAFAPSESDEILQAAAEIETAEEQLAAHLAAGGLLREGYERLGTA
jgi:4-hydroxy-4-methyl-2-oxoglutarate aldolase